MRNSNLDRDGLGGGGIRNRGTLTIINATVSGNNGGQFGGGSSNGGMLTIINSTVSGNFIGDDSLCWGGGILNVNGGMLTVLDSTVSCNRASCFRDNYGGGIYNSSNSTVTVLNSTISGNSLGGSWQFGGGIFSDYPSAPLALTNTIVAGNTDRDVWGYYSGHHNLIGGNPELGPLQNNGGPTWTQALLPGSPALNAGDPEQLGSPDQRGVLRSGGVNIGAYQASASAFLLTTPDTVTAGVPFDVIVTAVDVFAQTAVGYTGTVTFSTSDPDPDIVLPADYTFTAEDGGVHTFTDTGLGEVTLLTPGDQTITATDTMDDTIRGNATVTVGSANARLSGSAIQPLGPSTARTAAQTRHALSGREVAAADRLFAPSEAKCSALFWHRLSHEGQGESDWWRFV